MNSVFRTIQMTRLSCSQPSVFASAPGNKVLYKQASKYSPNEQTPLLLHRACQQGFILPGPNSLAKQTGEFLTLSPATCPVFTWWCQWLSDLVQKSLLPRGSGHRSPIGAQYWPGLTNHKPGCDDNQRWPPGGRHHNYSSLSQHKYLWARVAVHKLITRAPVPSSSWSRVPSLFRPRGNLVPATRERDVIKLCRCHYKP